MDKPDLADVLAEVNRLRAEHGIGEPLTEMPKGECCNPYTCVLAQSLGADEICGVMTSRPIYRLERRGVSYALPRLLTRFANAFDAERYPELIA